MFGPFGLFGMRFDLPEFFVGVATGLLIVFFIFRMRPLTSWLRGLVGETFQRASESFTAGAQDRYGVELIQRAELMHLSSEILTLSEIAVPPRILTPAISTDPDIEVSTGTDTLSVLPNLPDVNFLTAVYSGPSIELAAAVRRGDQLLLTGPVGSGKSTALAYLAIQAAQGQLRREDGDPFIPILLHAADLELERGRDGPEQVLVDAVQRRVSSGLASRLPTYLKAHLSAGRALILFDGSDEYPVEALRQFAGWLVQLKTAFPDSQFVVAGPIRGYDGIVQLGLAPVALAPWSDHQIRLFNKRWGGAWKEHVEPHMNRNRLEQIDPALMSGWLLGSLGLTPLELTLRAWAAYAGDTVGATVLDHVEAYLRRFLSAEEQQSAASVAVAWLEAQTGAFDESAVPRGSPLADLAQAGILIERPRRTASLRVPGIGAYLAGQGMSQLGVPETVDKPGWDIAATAHAFYVSMTEASEEVSHYLEDDNDPLYSRKLRVGQWLKIAPTAAKWRPGALRALGKIMQDSKLAFGLRLRATHAMAESKEPTASVFFKRLLGSDRPRTRILGALGLGGVRDMEAVKPLNDLLQSDPDLRVRQAASLALAALGIETALESLGEALLNGVEEVRVAAAEALAIHIDEGHAMLKEAATLDDLLTRRAAVFGLARIPADWARELLETMQVDDNQWVVRGAAAEALEKITNPQHPIVPPPQEIAEIPWLVSFAEREGLGVAPGRPALEMLRRALNNTSPEIRLAALETLAWVEPGELDLELKQALREGESYIRDAAFEALWRQRAHSPARAVAVGE
jgi:HEAT repeat protein